MKFLFLFVCLVWSVVVFGGGDGGGFVVAVVLFFFFSGSVGWGFKPGPCIYEAIAVPLSRAQVKSLFLMKQQP